jgi:hypothetical protein
MDASEWLGRRPDWRCRADWTPVGGLRGVQIWVVWRNGRLLGVGVASRFGGVGRIGRHLRAGAASRFLVVADLDACWMSARRPDLGVYGGMDASGRLAWRPDWGCMAEWTPVGGWRGVQILGGC